MARKPRVNTNPVANAYTEDNERIIEFSDAKLQVGGLIALRRTSDGRLLVQVYRQDEGVDVSYEGEGKAVEILHVRDPDEGCFHTVFVNGTPVRDVTIEDVDPGRGYERAGWDEHTASVRADENYSEAFKAAVIEARDYNADSQFIVGEPATLEERADAWWSRVSAETTATELEAIKAAILQLALLARSEHPNAHAVLLEDSDQGPWLVVEDVVDVNGEPLDDFFEDDGYASWLVDTWRPEWEHYLPMTRTTRNNPQWTLVIDTVLAQIVPSP